MIHQTWQKTAPPCCFGTTQRNAMQPSRADVWTTRTLLATTETVTVVAPWLACPQPSASFVERFLYIFTVYGAIYGYFLFDEKFENYHFIGTILVFIGIYLAKKNNVKKV